MEKKICQVERQGTRGSGTHDKKRGFDYINAARAV